MKKLLFLIALAFTITAIVPTVIKTNEATAQMVTTLTPIAANDTLTDADTAYVYITTSATYSQTFSSTKSIADNISRAVTIRAIKIDGTVAGTATFQGSNDGTNWETISSAYTVTNTADQVKTFDMRSAGGDLLFTYFRVQFLSSGTNRHIPKVYYMRRSN